MIQIDPIHGLLKNVRQIPSPNCNDRPKGEGVNLLVIHNISLPPREFGGPYIDALFTNTLESNIHPYFATIASQRVSSHCLIRRDGALTQYVPFTKRAWHAGVSEFQGKSDCNDYSIGIELEGADDIPYTDVQYAVLADLIITLQGYYPGITWDRIVGHSTIAPDRKTDPGSAFDWNLLANILSVKNVKSEKLNEP